MKFFRPFGFVLAIVLALPTFAQLPTEPRFGHEKSDLKPDPEVKYGKLQNGLRFAIRKNTEPRGRASLRLLVLAGSFHETEEQRGLAHFLEHMAFNGSENYAPDTLIEFFQRMGMSFGGDTNAHTSFDHTAYVLELPHTDEKTLDEGFRVFRDYATGLLLLDKEIEKERGIILAEKRDRDTVPFREWVAEATFVLPETRLPSRIPIGTEEVIQTAPRERFVDFYRTWYRPERLAIVAVGDFDPAAIEREIVETFGSLVSDHPVRENPSLGRVTAANQPKVFWHHEPESGATRVGLQVVTPYVREEDTAAKRSRDILRELATMILNRRLDTLARTEGAPFSRGYVAASEEFDLFRSASIELTARPETWQAALSLAEQELRKALMHGFTKAEVAEAAANLTNALTQAERTAATRHSDGLADALMNSLLNGAVFTTPADNLRLLGPVIASATPTACLDALREAFAGAAPIVTVVGNTKVADTPEAADQAIMEVVAKSAQVAVAAPAETNVAPFSYVEFGPAGAISDERKIDDLGINTATFANGVRANLKPTDFEAGKIRILVRVGAGLLTMPKDKPGLNLLADASVFTGGLGKHSIDELRQILAGRTVSVNFRTAGDAFTLVGETNSDDLLLQLQLLAAYLLDPGFRPEALLPARKQFEQLYKQLEHIPEGPLQLEAIRLMGGGDPRIGIPKQEELAARTLDEVRAWLSPQFATGALEISLVGDLQLEAARDALSRTFGALPARQKKPALEAERALTPPPALEKTYEFQSEIPKALVYTAWITTDNRDVTTARRLNLLAEVFSDRLRKRVREQLGDAYSPYAFSAPSDSFRNYGTFAAVISASPDKLGVLSQVVTDIARELIDKGITDDEVERAKQPVLTSIRDAGRTNPYWLFTVIGASQEFPERLEWRRTIESGHAAITAAQLHEMAKQYLQPERAFRFATKAAVQVAPTPVPTPSPRPTTRVLTQKPTPTPKATPTPVPDDF
ncbi:MAG: insulinase family protein [Opitutaceae bacterium]|nr:insulinase family protein [Opitutaceae bacterium]